MFLQETNKGRKENEKENGKQNKRALHVSKTRNSKEKYDKKKGGIT